MSLFAARNIARAVDQFKGRGYAQLKGIILNSRGVANELDLVKRAAQDIGTEVVAEVPRDPTIQACEDKNMTVIGGGALDSPLAKIYGKFAQKIMD